MATGSNPNKPSRGKRPKRQTDAEPEDLALAEELLRVSRAEQADLVAGWKKLLKQLGIKGKPIGAKKLQEMAIREGVKAENNEFSRAIMAMREE
jgi:hypothetical protein